MNCFRFKELAKDKKTKARLGEIHTPHGVIKTPAFVPVGTQATVKSLSPNELHTLGVQLYFVNTYHMYLRPGIDVVKKLGGLHTFMHWPHPLITDSGGFQVFSLGRVSCHSREGGNLSSETRIPDQVGDDKKSLVKISEEGVEFRSHWDGTKHLFTPELSMKWQCELGSDIHIAFDDCTSYPVTHTQAKKSMEQTHRWAKRSLDAHRKLIPGRARDESITYQALYGSIQGSVFEDLRKDSAKFISSMDFDGIAIGGVAVGETKKEMVNVVKWVVPLLPDEKPRHLLGVGDIDDIFALVESGIDTFDCVQPSRLARMGWLYTTSTLKDHTYTFDITKAIYAGDKRPIEDDCMCYTCQNFSRAYVHHLFHVRELLAYRLATIHNIFFVQHLVLEIRESIEQGSFLELKRKWLYY